MEKFHRNKRAVGGGGGNIHVHAVCGTLTDVVSRTEDFIFTNLANKKKGGGVADEALQTFPIASLMENISLQYVHAVCQLFSPNNFQTQLCHL